jgi:AraC-like DNA-binding protein/ligand-binding sensor protein
MNSFETRSFALVFAGDQAREDVSLLEQLISNLEHQTGLKLNYDDLTGLTRDIPDLKLRTAFQIHTCQFCALAKSTQRGLAQCVRNKRLASRRAVQQKNPYHGMCHLGLTDMVQPLVIHHVVAGVFYYGSVVVRETEKMGLARVKTYCRRHQLDPRTYLARFQKAPRISQRDLPIYQRQLEFVVQFVRRMIESWKPPLERYRQEQSSVHWLDVRQCSPLIGAAVHVMQRQYAEPLTLSLIAKQVHCHPVHLSKAFKKEMKILFSDYLHQLRISHARMLLTMNRLSVGEVGFRVGYQDESHFNKVFQRLVGQTPGEYRRTHLLQAHAVD